MAKRRYPIDSKEWLAELAASRRPLDIAQLQKAIDLYAENNEQREKGLGIADILLSLGLDTETLATTIVWPALQAHAITQDHIIDTLGEDSIKLLHDVHQMQSLGKLQHLAQRGHHQIENLRKMLLAMVTDVRSVLVVLAERLWQLRQAKQLEPAAQQALANETMAVYAPLANRLGVWQLKWEIEDLCLRYLHPDIYSQIARDISTRRDEREAFVHHFNQILQDRLTEAGIKHFQIMGRVKHIYSIYKKMQRKKANLKQIYDMTALRVLVDTIPDCYAVLAVLQNGWAQVPEEFDDYVSQPKQNGYQSIHTVLIGENNVFVEVQIRTQQMHQESELGVAAHWRYKEGVLQPSSYESKIALLRQIMAWQKEVAATDEAQPATQNATPAVVPAAPPTQDLFAQRVYVFTPMGDILDLPQGSTPLDFAYTVHSEVGHRCRGAKVDGHIVPLTYQLRMGQRVEILTAKHPNPSRDWMNPHLKFLKAARNRAKVMHWFRIQESQNAVPEKLVKHHHPQPELHPPIELHKPATESAPAVSVVGIDNLLTHVARCCKPLPGDAVIGYVTVNRGVTIHRRDCRNLRNMLTVEDSTHRKIEVSWGEKNANSFNEDLTLRVYDRPGLLRDITTLLAGEKINVSGLQTFKTSEAMIIDIYLTIEVHSRAQLKLALDHLQKLPNIIQLRRR